MSDLIEAMQIFLTYGHPDYPTHCEHDVLTVDIRASLVSVVDKDRLDKLGFVADDDEDKDCFISFRFGSC